MKLVELPHYISLDRYEQSISSMVKRLSEYPGVRAIYQIGGVSTPGISDIDLLVVFEDGISCHQNPLRDLGAEDRYFYIHNLYGLSLSHFRETFRYVFFHNYNRLWGEDLIVPAGDLERQKSERIQTQVGLEYLIKLFISMTVERTYGIAKVRNLLLHAKALKYDLADLEITSGPLPEMIAVIIGWRTYWFNEQPRHEILIQWLNEFYHALKAELGKCIAARKFYLPDWVNLRISRNMLMVPSEKLGYRHRGLTLPKIFGGLGQKYFNVQHRFNSFEFLVPVTTDAIPQELVARHEFITMLNAYNARHLPAFVPVAYGLPVFVRGKG
jgi:hypothetical protein